MGRACFSERLGRWAGPEALVVASAVVLASIDAAIIDMLRQCVRLGRPNRSRKPVEQSASRRRTARCRFCRDRTRWGRRGRRWTLRCWFCRNRMRRGLSSRYPGGRRRDGRGFDGRGRPGRLLQGGCRATLRACRVRADSDTVLIEFPVPQAVLDTHIIGCRPAAPAADDKRGAR